jgi:hypothetical protein
MGKAVSVTQSAVAQSTYRTVIVVVTSKQQEHKEIIRRVHVQYLYYKAGYLLPVKPWGRRCMLTPTKPKVRTRKRQSRGGGLSSLVHHRPHQPREQTRISSGRGCGGCRQSARTSDHLQDPLSRCWCCRPKDTPKDTTTTL